MNPFEDDMIEENDDESKNPFFEDMTNDEDDGDDEMGSGGGDGGDDLIKKSDEKSKNPFTQDTTGDRGDDNAVEDSGDEMLDLFSVDYDSLSIPWKSFLQSFNLNVKKLYKPTCVKTIGIHLKSLKALSIVGKWGSGRTTLAKQVILQCAQSFVNSTCKFTTIDRATSWKKGVHDGCVSFIYLPDCIKEWYTPSHVEDVAECLKDMLIRPSDQCYVVLSVNENTWSKYEHILSQCDIFKEKRLHFMQNKEILSSNDYKEMLHVIVQNRVKLDSLTSKTSVILAAKENDVIGLPELMTLSCKNRRILSNVARFCAEPLSVIKDDLKQMSEFPKISEKHKFVVLIYAMIHNGSFSLQKLNENMLRSIRTIFAVFSPPDDYFEDAVDKLMEEYLEISTDKETLCTQHEIIKRILFEIVAEIKIEFLIQNCDSRLLLNCIRPATFTFSSMFSKFNKDLVVGIEPGHHQALCERFKQIEIGGENEVRKHLIMEDAAFQRLMML
uniref:Uncharacterized protein n=1 Tax=Magallana gigas TaxID=29159 RepID=A0A8W8N0F0_MAGGI|nr:uncharacterized protein LOC105329328 [Crassostrea gigas]XP_019923212.2 uncharacterized protein LOC105329328 [Crassostrea gigas]